MSFNPTFETGVVVDARSFRTSIRQHGVGTVLSADVFAVSFSHGTAHGVAAGGAVVLAGFLLGDRGLSLARTIGKNWTKLRSDWRQLRADWDNVRGMARDGGVFLPHSYPEAPGQDPEDRR
ncbi:hypothetical protein [Nocardia sp. NPDC004722]